MTTSSFSPTTATALIETLHAAEKLKCELRHSFTSNRRQESVAEHCWRAALLALVMGPYVHGTCDISRVIELLLVHDLCEVYAGDIPIFAECERKEMAEEDAVARFITHLPQAAADKVSALWTEYLDGNTLEAKIAHVIDKFEAQLQHNEAPLDTWIEWEKERVFNGFTSIGEFDPALSVLRDSIIEEATAKLKTSGEDITRFPARPAADGTREPRGIRPENPAG
jgi:5'-deoxynucleotidase YfbR-like HD superfamily hydrolase